MRYLPCIFIRQPAWSMHFPCMCRSRFSPRCTNCTPLLHHVAAALPMRGGDVLCGVQVVVEQQRELMKADGGHSGDLRAAATAALQHSAEAVQHLRRHFEGQARLLPCVRQERWLLVQVACPDYDLNVVECLEVGWPWRQLLLVCGLVLLAHATAVLHSLVPVWLHVSRHCVKIFSQFKS